MQEVSGELRGAHRGPDVMSQSGEISGAWQCVSRPPPDSLKLCHLWNHQSHLYLCGTTKRNISINAVDWRIHRTHGLREKLGGPQNAFLCPLTSCRCMTSYPVHSMEPTTCFLHLGRSLLNKSEPLWQLTFEWLLFPLLCRRIAQTWPFMNVPILSTLCELPNLFCTLYHCIFFRYCFVYATSSMASSGVSSVPHVFQQSALWCSTLDSGSPWLPDALRTPQMPHYLDDDYSDEHTFSPLHVNWQLSCSTINMLMYYTRITACYCVFFW